MEICRCENRPNDKIRPISVKVGVIESADGSAEFSLGNTRVLAVVHGPVAAKSRLEQIDRATLKVSVESLDTPPSN